MIKTKTILNDNKEKIFIETYVPKTIKSTIVFCHGITGCRKGRTMADDYFQRLAKILMDKNYKVVLFDYSGHGESEGKSEDVVLSKSVSELAKVIQSEKVDVGNVNFLVFSYGTTVLCRFLEQNKNIKPKHIAMISPGLDPLGSGFLDENNIFGKDIAKAYYSGEMKKNGFAVVGVKGFKLGFNFIEELKNFKPDYLTKVGSKLLCLSGTNDVIINTKFNHDFCKKHKIKNVDLVASHSLFEDIDTAFELIVDFFEN